ncbi:hypothetical protein [Levilactobacillus cerevisiae]|uniref:hypothetical protein n=1 Tax=Levilactobacillus cerevisiae TaxID=1704076 RepID=UPI000F79F1A7|nr:hypothetical protein [Levilactobacillus cerevisiae]
MKRSKKIYIGIGIFLGILLLFIVQATLSRSTSKQVTPSNEMTIKAYSFSLKESGTAFDTAIPLADASVKIYGINSKTGKQISLASTTTNAAGVIRHLKLKATRKFDRIKLTYFFGEKARGYAITLKDARYQVSHTLTVPKNRILSSKRISVYETPAVSSQMYYQLARLNRTYADVFRNQSAAIKAASSYIDMSRATLKPIDLIYDPTLTDSQSSFHSRGKSDNDGGVIRRPVICINTSNQTQMTMNSAVSHEWAHWNMWRVNDKLAAGSYRSHSAYNVDPGVSYKEGWAIFQRYRYMYGLTKAFAYDTLVQKNASLYGKSTNNTVWGALNDLFDINYGKYAALEDDPFDVYQLFVHGNDSLANKELINEGLMYGVMVNSRATTFKEFYQYLATYADKSADKTIKSRLVRAMAVNGIDKHGNFKVKG